MKHVALQVAFIQNHSDFLNMSFLSCIDAGGAQTKMAAPLLFNYVCPVAVASVGVKTRCNVKDPLGRF